MEFLVERTDFYRFYAKKSHIEGQVRFLDPTWQKSWFLAFSKGFHDGSQNASYVAFWGTKSFWVPKNHQNFDFLPFNYIFWVKSAIWDNFDFCHFLLGKPLIFKWKNLWNLQNSFFFKLRLKRFLENLSHHFKDNDQKNMFLASYPPKQANYTLNFVQGLILFFDAFSAV